MENTALLEWLSKQLAKFEQSVSARECMEKTERGGTDASWRAVARATRLPYLTKAQRLEGAERHKRIAAKDRHDVEMCKAVIAALSPPKIALPVD